MDRVAKLFFAIAFAATVLAACNKSGGGVKVNSPRNGKPGITKPGAQDKTKSDAAVAEARGEDVSKMTPEEKKKIEATAADIKALRPLFRDANNIFLEFWPKIIHPESGQKENIFNFIYWALDQNFTPKGIPVKKAEKEKAKTNCSIGLSEVKKVNLLTYEINFAPCSELSRSARVAEITKHNEGWSVVFEMTSMSLSPKEMMGRWISTLHNDLVSECEMVKMPHGRLGTLNCKNIGQDISTTKYALIKDLQFKYPLELKNTAGKIVPLTLDYALYNVDGSGKATKYDGKAVDDYVTNTFVIKMAEEAPPETNDDAVNAKVAADFKANQAEEIARMKREEEERRGQQPAQQSGQEQLNQGQQQGRQQGQQQGQPDSKINASGLPAAIQRQQSGDSYQQQDPNQQQDDQGQRQDYPPAT